MQKNALSRCLPECLPTAKFAEPFLKGAVNDVRLGDLDALKKEIVDLKLKLRSENQDYYTGYICALSVVEGIIAYAHTIDAVPVETVAQMFFDFTGDKCPCNFNNNDEWLPLVCEYEAEGKCPDPEDVLGCWKQYIKHYGERKDGDG